MQETRCYLSHQWGTHSKPADLVQFVGFLLPVDSLSRTLSHRAQRMPARLFFAEKVGVSESMGEYVKPPLQFLHV